MEEESLKMANLGGGTFPQVDADKELNPAKNKQFQVDSVSSRVAEIKVINYIKLPNHSSYSSNKYTPSSMPLSCHLLLSISFSFILYIAPKKDKSKLIQII